MTSWQNSKAVEKGVAFSDGLVAARCSALTPKGGARTFAGREEFFATRMSRQKTDCNSFATYRKNIILRCVANSARLFWQQKALPAQLGGPFAAKRGQKSFPQGISNRISDKPEYSGTRPHRMVTSWGQARRNCQLQTGPEPTLYIGRRAGGDCHGRCGTG